jgi:flagellar basal body rod protein FlgC
MSIATYSALAGMRSAMLRLETSARNVARAGATQSTSATSGDGGPVYVVTRLDQADFARPVPAVSSVSMPNSAPAWLAAQEDTSGGGGAPGGGADEVNLAQEALEQASARTSLMANAKVLQVTQDMVKRLFELEG